MVAVDLALGRITVDGFGRIKRWPIDQVAVAFVDGFVSFVDNYEKSRSSQSEVEQTSM